MRNIFIVSQEQADLARRLESLLIELPKESGVLFAAATIDGQFRHPPDERVGPLGEWKWGISVVVGCARNLEVTIAEALVWAVVSKDPHLEAIRDRILVHVYRGVARLS